MLFRLPPGFNAPKTPLQKFEEESKEASKREREAAGKIIGEEFGHAQSVLGASRDVGREQLKEEFARQGAITGGPGGARMKSLGKAITGLERGFGQEASGLRAQEAAARAQAEESATQRDLQRQQLGLQESQFARTLDFQEKEFRENLKTNFINTAVALKNAGLQNADNWMYLLGSQGIMPQIYGDRAPNITDTMPGYRLRGNARGQYRFE